MEVRKRFLFFFFSVLIALPYPYCRGALIYCFSESGHDAVAALPSAALAIQKAFERRAERG